ncbi:hypothetical protein Bca101_012439 [Brassica carinata]
MATDEPSLTRWSFLFGRKKLPEDPQEAKPEDGSSSNKEEEVLRAVMSAVFFCLKRNDSKVLGFLMIVGGKKSMFPPFESAETRALAESLSRDIIRGNPNVKWESIKGLENAIISFIYQASERRGVEDTLNG